MNLGAILGSIVPTAPAMQFIAYSVLTIASVIVAATQLFLAYRQNFGWKPLLLVTNHALTSGTPTREYYGLKLDMEIWNRRKYPVVVRRLYIEFSRIEVVAEVPEWVYGAWNVGTARPTARYEEELVLEPSSYKTVPIDLPFKRLPLDALRDRLRITAFCFDPRKNRIDKIKIRYVYEMNAFRAIGITWRRRLVRAVLNALGRG